MLVLFLSVLSLAANNLFEQPIELEQPDSTKLSLFVSGDEFVHLIHDARGYTVVTHPETGYAVYALPEGSGIKHSEYRVGSIDPATLGISPYLKPESSLHEAAITSRDLFSTQGPRTTAIGIIDNIFVFVRFLDQAEYTTQISAYESLCNSTVSTSMRGYFLHDSVGQLTVNTSFFPAPVGGMVRSFQDGHNRGYFTPYNSATNPIGYESTEQGRSRMHALMRTALNIIIPSVPTNLVVDHDGDGYVDNVTFVFQGNSNPAWGSILWPQQWFLEVNPFLYPLITINNKIVSCYNIQLSDQLVDPVNSNVLSVGVVCHEMSHSIGFPDLYHYSHDGFSPVGAWDIMGNNGATPQPRFVQQKMRFGGWIDSIPTITPSANPVTYTLTAVNDDPFSCYKIPSSMPNQFYVVEYRRNNGSYGAAFPGSGLIVYRATPSILVGTLPFEVEGNNDGPPDEVYVFRPGGDFYSEGSVSTAHLSRSVGRSSIHNSTDTKPWLYTFAGIGQIEGNLMLTDITENSGNTISFTLHGANLNIWQGDIDSNWNTASNWSLGTVPTSNDWVEIPVTSHNYNPVVIEDGYARHITIHNGAGLGVGVCSLTVSEDIDNYGQLAVGSPEAVFIIEGDLIFRAGSSTMFLYEGHIYLKGDVVFHPGSWVDMNQGCLEFYGTGNSSIINQSQATINDLKSSKTNPYTVLISDESSTDLTVEGNIYVYSGSALTHPYAGVTNLKGSIFVYSDGYCAMNQGTIKMQGFFDTTLDIQNTNSYLNNLIIQKTGTSSVSLSANLSLRGNISIQGGILDLSTRTLKLGGNWTNSIGIQGFDCGVGTLMLNGTANQTVSSERFYRLELNKSAGTWLLPTGVAIEADYYNWTAGAYSVTGGSFSVTFLDDPGIFGTINLSSGAINYHQTSTSFIDLRAQLTISGGVFTISGGSSTAYFSYIDTATLTMSGGVLDFQNQGILVPDMFAFNDNITGGTIRTAGSFLIERADFNPSGGIIDLYGSQDSQVSSLAGSNFYNLVINKAPLRELESEEQPLITDLRRNRTESYRSNIVIGLGTLDINGYFKLQSGTFVAPPAMKVAGNWMNQLGAAAFTEGTGSVTFDGTGVQYCNYSENFSTLILNKGDRLKVSNSLALVTCTSYTWTAGALEVISGTFTAWDLSQNGIYGSYFVNPLGVINLYQGATQRIHLNGFLSNSGGTINVYGGSHPSSFAYSAAAGIVMNAGSIDFKDKGISIAPSTYSLSINITGGTLRTTGGFADNRGGLGFGGVLELYGSGISNLLTSSTTSLNNVRINKAGTRAPISNGKVEGHALHPEDDFLRENSVLAISNLQVTGSLEVLAGIFDVNGRVITINNDLLISGILRMNAANSFIDVNDNLSWLSGSSSSIGTGSIYCGGNLLFENGSDADLSECLTRLDNSYGASLTNNSFMTTLGDLEFLGTDEDPVFNYLSNASLPLNIAGYLRVFPVTKFDLQEGICHVNGNIYLDDTSLLNIGDGGSLETDGHLDLQGSLITGPGSAVVHGEFISYPSGLLSIDQGSFINDAPWLEMRSNTVYLNCDISVISGSFEITHKTLVLNSAPLRIFENSDLRVGAGFSATALGTYEPLGGQLSLIGSHFMNLLSISGSNYASSLVIGKDNSECTVYLQDPLVVNNELRITGGVLNTYGFALQTGWINIFSGSLELFSTLSSYGSIMVSGTLGIYENASLLLSGGQNLSVISGGLLRVLGSVANPALISGFGAGGYYGLSIGSGAVIEASFATFEYMNTSGLNIQNGAMIDEYSSLDNCTFRFGEAGGTLLRINNAQNVVIDAAYFPVNFWGSAHNVSKTSNQGGVTFTHSTGGFSGTSFEQDVYNRILWQNIAVPAVSNLTISYHSSTNTIQLNWDYPFPYQNFKIYRSTRPDGVFSYHGTTSNTSWSELTPGRHYFYEVVAVQ